MQKITGIKSVDFKIEATGSGVVNWNGQTDVNGVIKGEVKRLENHSMPKLRGYSNKRFKDDGTYSLKFADQVDFTKNKLYISQNCIRHHLFRSQSLNLDLSDKEVGRNIDKVLCSMVGLIRGYVITDTENKRTSPLLITDFIDQLGEGNYEQMGRSGSKAKRETKSGTDKSNTMFSKTTFGETHYLAHGSISIEQLQFISLDERYSRQSISFKTESQNAELAEQLTAFIASLTDSEETASNVKAIYHPNYVRRGAIFNHGEQGILLNNEAIDVLVKETLCLIENLRIIQAKGYMYVTDVKVDYNDSEKAADMMRIIKSDKCDSVEPTKQGSYAVYFEGVDQCG